MDLTKVLSAKMFQQKKYLKQKFDSFDSDLPDDRRAQRYRAEIVGRRNDR